MTNAILLLLTCLQTSSIDREGKLACLSDLAVPPTCMRTEEKVVLFILNDFYEVFNLSISVPVSNLAFRPGYIPKECPVTTGLPTRAQYPSIST